MIDDAEIKRLRALCDAATPGLDSPSAAPGWCWERLADNVFEVQRCNGWSVLLKRAEDAHFIVASRSVMPKLLDAVEASLAPEFQRECQQRIDALEVGLLPETDALKNRIATIVDENCGIQPTEPAHDSLTRIEQKFFQDRQEIERLRELLNHACNWLEARSDRDARLFHAAHLRKEIL